MVLGQIWALADMDMDGKMDKKEFSIAMFLIKKTLEGLPLPCTLPLGLKNDPQPSFITPGVTLALSLVSNSGHNGLSSVPSSNGQDSNISSTAYQDWIISSSNRPRYRLLFNQHDRNKRGYLTGVEARSILLQYGLSNTILAHIWNLADLDKDGNLNCDEFCIAIFLIEKVLSGSQLPNTLPSGLLPSSQQRTTGHTSPSISVKQDDNESSENKSSSLSFEDKRRENFRQGQAELDRRKQELAEKMRLDEEIRLENERLEKEKQQKLRMEKERQQAAEAEKQAEFSRQLEAQREQRRRQAVENRMRAAREAEKQRQVESERIRTDALLKERNHIQTLLEQAVAHRASLLESASSQQQRLAELDSRLVIAQTEVNSHKTSINEMRSKRDSYERDIRDMTEQMEAAKAELTHWQREKEQLSLRMAAGVDMNPVMEQYKTLQSMREARIRTIEQLRSKLNDLDQNMTQQGHELATRRNKIDDSHSRVSQKMQAYKLKRKSTDLSIPTSNTGSVQKELYEAMFDFTARHPDELSFTTGTLIDVFANAPINVGPGWLYGQINDRVGLFPETYVRKKVDGKIDPFDPFGVHKIMTNTSAPGGVIMTTATTIGTTTASTTNIPLNTTTAKSTNSFTEPLDKPVKSESDTKLGDAITDNDNNEFYGKVQQDWDISMSTISLPENITPDQLLTLKIEDNVKIIKENYNKEWLFGEITDKSGSVIKGWFPANCLKPFTKPSSLDFNFGLNMSSSPSYSSKQPNNILFSCIALYPYESNVPGDLNLSVGDLIRVYVIKDDWWEGVCERTQLKGLFPANYVRKLSIEENRSTEEKLLVGGLINDQVEQNNTNSPSQPKIIPVSSLKLIEANPDNNCTTSLLSSSNVSSSSSSGGVVVCTQPEFARVIAPYKATSTGQLTLQPGQVVQLRKRSPKGWWEGELQQRGHIRQIGWFPADFVRLITPLTVNGSSNSSDQQLLSKSTSSTNNETENNTPTSLKALASKAITIPNDADSSIHDLQQTQSNRVEMMQTIFSYKAVHADELTFEEGAIITVLGRDEPEWWRGRLQSSGAEGLFPVNYVRPYNPPQTKKASNSVIPAQINSDISRNLRERNFAIKELIETELVYNKSLIEVQDVFYKPLKASKMLTMQQLDDIFPHWNELIDTSTEFYHDLNDCLEANPSVQSVGQILLKHMVKFKVYRHYCIRQRVACETLQHCLSTNYRLNQLVKIFEMNTKTKGLPLSSYLLKPMQRITKYKLIVEKIALSTDLSLPNHDEFLKARNLLCALLKSIDHAVGFEDCHDQIEWFRSRLMGADKCLLNWLSSSTTLHSNDKPHLVHCGTLYKAKNNREFVCFLFNKYLILTTPNYATCGQLFEFPPINDPNAMKWSFTLYKEPLPLNQIYVFKGSFKHISESITPPPHSAPYNKSMSNEIVRCVSTCTLSESIDNSTFNNRRPSEIVKYSTTNVFSLLKRRNSWQPIVTLKAHLMNFALKNEYPQHLMFTVLNVCTNSQDQFEVHFKISITDQMWKFCQIIANQSLLESKTSETLNFIMPESSEKSLHITAFKSLPFINSNMIGSCIMPFSSIFTHFPPISHESITKQIELDQSIGMKVEFSDPEIIKRLNLAPEIREDYAELFQITLWTSIALILIVWGVSWGIWNMDPGRDGIIYRGTMTRPKQD
ncbi:Intersectin-1 [Schistosoma japonicum]|uniref:Intersectin-1 n=1 Tax=Schistosoma japonicum TaxID=6182 RepID=A0A4Z2DQE4_SCHJA|nr:Intersectin-1 [Schistosoma japonicum]